MSIRTTHNPYPEAILSIALIAFWMVAAAGWIANIIKLFGTIGEPITGFFILRCVGIIVAPLGAVIGWF